MQLSQAALQQALRQAGSSKKACHSSFVDDVANGRASIAQLQQYTARLWTMAAGFPMRLASVLRYCDAPNIRHSLIKNMLEEEGVMSYRVGELTVDTQKQHGEICARLARALGVTAPEANSANDWVERALLNGEWRAAFAYMGIGFEFNVPATFAKLAAGLQTHYGLDAHALEFLLLHGEADQRHGEEAIVLLVSACSTDAHAAQAIQGARRGALSWWLFHEQFSANAQARAA
jgi:pyrroloquinoline quinone (PQQ) biosynthesis protein C